MAPPDQTGGFEVHRRHLTALAYRMLGAVSEAEDVVQDAYLRWHGAGRQEVENPRAFLSTIVTRLCLDRLKAARATRETYIGPWLPEPVLGDDPLGAESASDLAHDLSFALMMAMERLSPLERAAFLLHDVFEMDFAEVARALGRSEAACRQLAARARRSVRAERPRYTVSPDEGARLAQSFLAASRSGDAEALARLLAADAALHTDGGGKTKSARNVIRGADRIVRFFCGLAAKASRSGQPRYRHVEPARINGLPGFLALDRDGTLHTMALEPEGGRIRAIYMVRNPDKLRHIEPSPARA